MSELSDMFTFEESSIFYYGWIVVLLSFFACFIGFGLIYSFAVFFKPLSAEFGWSRALISGAFSFYAILHNIMAFFAGRALDKVGPQKILTVAGICLGSSMIIMSHVHYAWQLYVYYGVFFSMGIACTYAPVIATVSRWFITKRGMAISLTATGIGCGALVFNPLCAWLIASYGWRNTYVILGITTWVVFIPIIMFVKKSPYEQSPHYSIQDSLNITLADAIKTRTFWALSLSWLFIDIALFTIMTHIVMLTSDRGMTLIMSGSIAGIIGGSSLLGRICGGYFSDKFGRKNIYIFSFIGQLVTLVWLLFATEVWMLFVFAIIFGIIYGVWAGIIGAFPVDYFGFKYAGEIIGFIVVLVGIGVAIGPYLAGVIHDVTRSYNYVIGMCIMATFAAIVSALFLQPVVNTKKKTL
ncbi:MAG TPA: MFS transporter [Syntrophales bacterium]|nr:MFS transporter [Syntrophales bacterium]